MTKYNIAIANLEVMIDCCSRDCFYECIKNLPEALPSARPIVSLDNSETMIQFTFVEMTNSGTLVYEFLSSIS